MARHARLEKKMASRRDVGQLSGRPSVKSSAPPVSRYLVLLFSTTRNLRNPKHGGRYRMDGGVADATC